MQITASVTFSELGPVEGGFAGEARDPAGRSIKAPHRSTLEAAIAGAVMDALQEANPDEPVRDLSPTVELGGNWIEGAAAAALKRPGAGAHGEHYPPGR